MSPLKVLIVRDGRPGHEEQSRAVVQALSGLTPVQQAMVRVPLPSFRTVAVNAVRYFMDGRTTGWPRAELVIGTGTGTHLPMLAYRRRHPGVRVVTCMLPDRLLRNRFDLCLVPRHDRPPERSNIFLTWGPPCMGGTQRDKDRHRGLVLVGGVDEKSHHWHTGTLISQVKAIVARCPEVTWVITSSPRTPVDTESALAALAGENVKVDFFPAEETYPGWIEQQYAASGLVWVTADSVSMLYEALTAGCSVGVLPVQWKKKDNKFQQGIDGLVSEQLVVPFDLWVTGQRPMPPGTFLDEAGRCAREILKRWWPARLA